MQRSALQVCPAVENPLTRLAHAGQDANEWLDLAHWQSASGETKSALATLMRGLALLPASLELLKSASDLALTCQRPQLSRRLRQRWVRLAPDCLQARFCLALAYEACQQPLQAEACYHAILKQDNQWVAVYHNLGPLLLKQGRYEEGIALFQQLRQLMPHYRPALLGLAMAYDYAGQERRALALYRQFCWLDPKAEQEADLHQRITELSAKQSLSRLKSRH